MRVTRSDPMGFGETFFISYLGTLVYSERRSVSDLSLTSSSLRLSYFVGNI